MTLRTLLEKGTVSLALLPKGNDYLLNDRGVAYRDAALVANDWHSWHALPSVDRIEYLDLAGLDTLAGYTVPLIGEDYGAKTPVMWNSLYERLGLAIRNIMVVGDPRQAHAILDDLRQDPKYLGGGAGVGFKEAVLPSLTLEPGDLRSVNIIVKRDGELIGRNTDALGFLRSLEDKLSTVGKTVSGGHFVLYGAGGVAKELGRLFGSRGASTLAIVNRTASKGVALANDLSKEFPEMESYGVPERLSRGIVLNSTVHPDALINTTEKGSDRMRDVAFYMPADPANEGDSRTLLRYLAELRPETVVADIVIRADGESLSLRLARAEGLKNLVNGIPMVVNQAAPAYLLIQNAHPHAHKRTVTEQEALEVFRDAAR